jgi:transcriptional regulator with XRE-family HTH domain
MTAQSEMVHQVGRRIAEIRQRAGLSQRELAERLGWTRDIIAHYELGRRALGLDRLAAIADVLHVSPATLIARDEQRAILLALDARPELLAQVDFFLTSIERGGDPPPPS